MSTTDAAVAAITLTEHELGPYVTHAPTRGLLTGPGLPCDGDLLTFAPLRTAGLRTLADATDGPARLAEELRDRLVIGELLGPAGMETESILLDGGTGEITTAYLVDPSDSRPFAPSLATLLRFAAVTEELAGLRGRFASFADHYGTETATEASRRLLALFEEDTDGDVPPYWKAAALIRPLSLAAGPGRDSGLTLDVPARLLDQEFGHGRVARFEEVDFPATLTHEPTRRFLRETGLPEAAVLFHLDTDVPLPTLTEYYTDERAGEYPLDELPAHSDHLIRLGYLVEDNSLVVDGTTGAVLNFSEPEATLYPLNTDVSTLAFTLWLLHRERAIDVDLGGELTTDAYDQLAATMIQVLSAVDPTGTTTDADWHYWTELFQDEAGGVL
ncbi:SUKH-4 family immunity protein [Streptomyces sp. HUAS TT20]|uniref:SUKH-4 family immunity protein n=1 Tax=Streptomyces sp. HUAS TT20 TaxID=3447509 RepID=UPI0021DA56D7|nr:SUKH-4 family immunity protein [Streptomyces sp. HUAS 15-9]UXY27875.1 SUKH-4 family immunity protein [Streptomyces sp. HUAS 15-9]